MKTIAFLSCSKSKTTEPAPARMLYTGAMFKKALVYAEEVLRVDEVYVFSAKYGVVPIDRVISPYSFVMHNTGTIKTEGAGMTREQKNAWYREIIPRVEEITDGARIIYLCNAHYRKGMPKGEVPMEGLCFGKCLTWLTDKIKEYRNDPSIT